jgi:hypothetical protein
MVWLVLGLLVWSGWAWGLTVDQVIALKRAGVSEELIRAMIRTEMKVRARGGIGRYVVELKGGRQVIVYQAASPRGVVDYRLEQGTPPADPATTAAVVAALGAPPPAAKAEAAARGYALHLASFRRRAGARRMARELGAKGVAARVQAVDLGAKGRWYRVLVGRFPSRKQAQAQGEKLKRAGSISSFRVIPL